MSPLRRQDRLDELERDIDRLRLEVVELDRAAGELLDGEEASELAVRNADAARMILIAKLHLHYDESKAASHVGCEAHGDAILASCPDCASILSHHHSIRALAFGRAAARGDAVLRKARQADASQGKGPSGHGETAR